MGKLVVVEGIFNGISGRAVGSTFVPAQLNKPVSVSASSVWRVRCFIGEFSSIGFGSVYLWAARGCERLCAFVHLHRRWLR